MAMRALNRPVIQRTEEHDTHQVIHPRNVLKAKAAFYADTNKPANEDDLIEAAEAAIEALAPQFFFWLDENVVTLAKARDEAWTTGITDATTDNLYRAAHDIRGMGATFGFPLASRVAESLVYLIDKIGLAKTPRVLIDKHIDAIRAIVREDARDDNKTGMDLVRQLAAVTNKLVEMHQERVAAGTA
jgi:chemotaxis protein histidine kinase CheA